MDTFTLLTLNVFQGSPLPGLFGGTGSLAHSERLHAQLKRVAQLRPDIICLQEVHSDEVRASYVHAFALDYDWFGARPRCRLGMLLVVVFNAFLVIGAYSLTDSALVMTLMLVVTRLAFVDSALETWMGEDESGLLVMWRRDRFAVSTPFEHRFFSHQHGDPLNRISRRGFIVGGLRFRGTSFAVVNAHMNALGDSSHRKWQAHQVARLNTMRALVAGDFNDAASELFPSEYADAADAAGERAKAPTWCACNHLTRGWCRAPDMRSDFVLGKNMAFTGCEIVRDLCSDHYGVLATVGVQ